MKILRMRAHRRSTVIRSTLAVLAVATLAAMATSAVAQPRPKKAPAKAPAKTPAPAKNDSGEIEMNSDDAKKPAKGSGAGSDVNPEEIEMGEEGKPGDLNADLNAADQSATVKVTPIKKTPLSWQDIVVVVRKPFLKSRRTELLPFVGTTMNDNMIWHYTVGDELAYYLTHLLAVCVEGQYYTHSFREPYDLVPRQARRLPPINAYKRSAAL